MRAATIAYTSGISGTRTVFPLRRKNERANGNSFSLLRRYARRTQLFVCAYFRENSIIRDQPLLNLLLRSHPPGEYSFWPKAMGSTSPFINYLIASYLVLSDDTRCFFFFFFFLFSSVVSKSKGRIKRNGDVRTVVANSTPSLKLVSLLYRRKAAHSHMNNRGGWVVKQRENTEDSRRLYSWKILLRRIMESHRTNETGRKKREEDGTLTISRLFLARSRELYQWKKFFVLPRHLQFRLAPNAFKAFARIRIHA